MIKSTTENQKELKLLMPEEVKTIDKEILESQNLYKELNSISFRISFEKLNTFYKKYPTKSKVDISGDDPLFE